MSHLHLKEEEEEEHASANMSLQLSFLMYWCRCVCVCVYVYACQVKLASSLKELVARLLIACSQNLTQNNMCNMSNHKNACAMYPKIAHAKN